MKVLLIEDELKASAFVAKGLTEAGFSVETAEDGAIGLWMAQTREYALVILDILLPGMDGWSVLAELRRAGPQVPVLCLTCRDSVVDRVRGLDLGADDYLVKPFAFTELLARSRALLRRGRERERSPMSIQVGDLEVDLVRQRATRSGNVLDLRPKEFTILALLARRAGEPLSRTVIVEQVWDADFDFETNVVDVQIKRLREKVDAPYERRLIHTIRGVGYVLEERN